MFTRMKPYSLHINQLFTNTVYLKQLSPLWDLILQIWTKRKKEIRRFKLNVTGNVS